MHCLKFVRTSLQSFEPVLVGPQVSVVRCYRWMVDQGVNFVALITNSQFLQRHRFGKRSAVNFSLPTELTLKSNRGQFFVWSLILFLLPFLAFVVFFGLLLLLLLLLLFLSLFVLLL